MQHDQATDQRAPASKDALVARVPFHHLQQRVVLVSYVLLEQNLRGASCQGVNVGLTSARWGDQVGEPGISAACSLMDSAEPEVCS